MASSEVISITTPREYLGFEVGDDRKLADWQQISGYFEMLGSVSTRVKTSEIGRSTEDNPFLAVTISSPENLANLEFYRAVQMKLADPRTIVDEGEAAKLIETGKVVVLVTCSIHATEVGAAQMSMALGHYLATSDDDDVRRILDDVILLLVPCVNPDGLALVKEWYDGTLGTQFEGVVPPFLYHKYTGHDNNRDWFMFTQIETKLVVEHLMNAWRPQIHLDLHQTRSNGMRMILPPLLDPVAQNIDPVVHSEIAMLGAAIANELTAEGKSGVAVNVVYDGYSPSRSYVQYHGGIRVLAEAASARIATPVEVPPSQLKAARGENPTEQSWNHPMPWAGGRWSLRDIVEYELVVVKACLGNAARYRDMWVRNFYEVGKRTTCSSGSPSAFIVPPGQPDPNTATEMLQILRTADIEVHDATDRFVADGRRYPTGTKVILSGQPYWSFAKTMMEVQRYPDIREYSGGPPRAPYDVTAHSLPLQMGVESIQVNEPIQAKLKLIDTLTPAKGEIHGHGVDRAEAYLLRPEANASVRAVNTLLKAGVEVGRAQKRFRAEGAWYPAGTFIVVGGPKVEAKVSEVANRESLIFGAAATVPQSAVCNLKAPRIGLYKSYVPTAEEGWTRLILEDYGFCYTSLVDEDLRQGELAERFDVILLPHQPVRHLNRGHDRLNYPSDYSDGLGKLGTKGILSFVEQGGTLVAWDGAARYAIRFLELPVTNVLAGVSYSDFFAPGSLLRVLLDTKHPICYGMPKQAAAMFVNGPAFEVGEGQVIGEYPSKNPLLSGWIVGPERIFGKAALVTVPIGLGEVVLMGFRVHFRAQARGTYKLLFNSLYHAATRR